MGAHRQHDRTGIALSGCLVLVTLLVGGLACRSDPEETSSTTTTTTTTTTVAEPVKCPNEEFGGACRGDVPAGTYATTNFDPDITFTVPDGWTNQEDLPDEFLLQLVDDPRYLGIYGDAVAPMECDEAPQPGVGHTVEDLTEWLTSHPGLITTEPEPVSVGGLDGVFLDITLDPSWTTTCPYSNGQPVVPFIMGGDEAAFHHVINPGFEERLYLLANGSSNIAIEVGPEGDSLQNYLPEVGPIIDDLQFDF